MENRKPPSFFNYRDPSVDRRCRPVPYKPPLYDLTETDDEINEYDSDTTEKTSTTSNSTTGDKVISNEYEKALVYLRLRPFPSYNQKLYKIDGNSLIVNEKSDKQIKNFIFTDVFDDFIEQNIIYDRCVYEKIKSEDNLTILTYGTSGSGKTFTLLGDSNNPGIIPRSFEHIFKYYKNDINPIPQVKIEKGRLYFLDDDDLEKQESQRNIILSNINETQKIFDEINESINQYHEFETRNCDEQTSVFIWLSFIEIYNENVYDLINEQIYSKSNNIIGNQKKYPQQQQQQQKRKKLKVITNNGNSFIEKLTSIYIKNSLEAYTILLNCLKRISYASTEINDNSSRSHCILFLDIIQYEKESIFTNISYKFCDLAGSERINKMGTTITQQNIRLKETQKINKSLSVLGRCLNVAHNNQINKQNDLIPYRESKLTMLLNQSLSGKERLTMIVNVMPIDEYHDENLNVLHFASIAKEICYKTPIKIKKKSRFSFLIKQQQQQAQRSPSIIGNIQIQNNSYSEAYEKLLEDLRIENDELREKNRNLQHQLLVQEIDIKQKLCSEFEQEKIDSDNLWKTIIEKKIEYATKLFEVKEQRYLKKIRELEAVIDELESEQSDSENDGNDQDDDNDEDDNDDVIIINDN